MRRDQGRPTPPPPSGPSTPPPPPGPKITPLDPDSDAGRAFAASLSRALAEISVAISRREAVARAGERAA